ADAGPTGLRGWEAERARAGAQGAGVGIDVGQGGLPRGAEAARGRREVDELLDQPDLPGVRDGRGHREHDHATGSEYILVRLPRRGGGSGRADPLGRPVHVPAYEGGDGSLAREHVAERRDAPLSTED